MDGRVPSGGGDLFAICCCSFPPSRRSAANSNENVSHFRLFLFRRQEASSGCRRFACQLADSLGPFMPFIRHDWADSINRQSAEGRTGPTSTCSGAKRTLACHWTVEGVATQFQVVQPIPCQAPCFLISHWERKDWTRPETGRHCQSLGQTPLAPSGFFWCVDDEDISNMAHWPRLLQLPVQFQSRRIFAYGHQVRRVG